MEKIILTQEEIEEVADAIVMAWNAIGDDALACFEEDEMNAADYYELAADAHHPVTSGGISMELCNKFYRADKNSQELVRAKAIRRL